MAAEYIREQGVAVFGVLTMSSRSRRALRLKHRGARLIVMGVGVLTAFCGFSVSTAWAFDAYGIRPDGSLTPNPSGHLAGSVEPGASQVASDQLRRVAGSAQDGWVAILKKASDILSGNSPTPASNPPPITQSGLNWCRWWAFSDMAKEVQNYPWLDVTDTLRSDVVGCLADSFNGNPSVEWEGIFAAVQNEAELVMAITGDSPDAAANALTVGFSLPSKTWIDWFTYSAEAVPPV